MTRSLEPQTDHDREPLAARLTDDDVAAFLETRPDFFIQNPDVLTALELPARTSESGITDFHAYALSALREKVKMLQSVQDDLTGIIRDNIRTQETIHEAVLAAVEAPDQESFLHCVLQRWSDILDVEAVALGLLSPPDEKLKSGNLAKLTAEDIDARFEGSDDNGGDPHTLFLNIDGDEPLFGPAAPLIQSCVLMRMCAEQGSIGILALGWREKDGFGPGRGTETLQFLTRSLSALIEQ
ncbi:MAG: DUF484 family protein [Pseudomonadota bacterium]